MLSLITLGIDSSTNEALDARLQKLIHWLRSAEKDALILAPEVAFSGFDYEHMASVSSFSKELLTALKVAVSSQYLLFSLIVKEAGKYYNEAVLIHNHQIIHSQRKENLFTLAKEHHYFEAAEKNSERMVNIEGLRVGILICFELRFLRHWQTLKGADIICIMAYWGKARAVHLQVLAQALSIMHQCYVMVSDHLDPDATASTLIFNPDGTMAAKHSFVEGMQMQQSTFDAKAVKTVRRYLEVKE